MRQPDLACDICRDLIPLVRDGVASEASRRAVEQHLAGCAALPGGLAGGGSAPAGRPPCAAPPAAAGAPVDGRSACGRAGVGAGVFRLRRRIALEHPGDAGAGGRCSGFSAAATRRLLPLGTAAVIGLFNLVELWAVSLRNAYDVPAALWNNAGYALIIAVFCLLLLRAGDAGRRADPVRICPPPPPCRTSRRQKKGRIAMKNETAAAPPYAPPPGRCGRHPAGSVAGAVCRLDAGNPLSRTYSVRHAVDYANETWPRPGLPGGRSPVYPRLVLSGHGAVLRQPGYPLQRLGELRRGHLH